MADPRFLLWVDLETTGTDEREDAIVEIAWLITTPTLDLLIENSVVVWPERKPDPETWDQFVRDMHTNNGLIGALRSDYGWDPAKAEARVLDDMAELGQRHEFMLAGSGVSHFDRRFLKTQMPDLERWLQYPNLDVGVLRRAWQLWQNPGSEYPGFNDGKTHRALDDIHCHLAEARWWFSMIRGIS